MAMFNSYVSVSEGNISQLILYPIPTSHSSEVVEWGWVKEDYYNAVMQPARRESQRLRVGGGMASFVSSHLGVSSAHPPVISSMA